MYVVLGAWLDTDSGAGEVKSAYGAVSHGLPFFSSEFALGSRRLFVFVVVGVFWVVWCFPVVLCG